MRAAAEARTALAARCTGPSSIARYEVIDVDSEEDASAKPRRYGQLQQRRRQVARRSLTSFCALHGRRRAWPRSHRVSPRDVIPLPTSLPDFSKLKGGAECEFERDAQVLALYPGTTCFYTGKVVQPPSKVRARARRLACRLRCS